MWFYPMVRDQEVEGSNLSPRPFFSMSELDSASVNNPLQSLLRLFLVRILHHGLSKFRGTRNHWNLREDSVER
jgi:hypothetical protein